MLHLHDLRSGFGASFYFNSLMLPPTSGMWDPMRSKTLRASSILLSIVTFACFQTAQSASAREYREKCEDRLKTIQYGTPRYDGDGDLDYSGVTYRSEVVNQ